MTSVSVNINSGGNMSILCKKIEILGEMLTFSLMCTTTESDYLFAKCAYLMCQNLLRKIQFLRIC